MLGAGVCRRAITPNGIAINRETHTATQPVRSRSAEVAGPSWNAGSRRGTAGVTNPASCRAGRDGAIAVGAAGMAVAHWEGSASGCRLRFSENPRSVLDRKGAPAGPCSDVRGGRAGEERVFGVCAVQRDTDWWPPSVLSTTPAINGATAWASSSRVAMR